MLKPPTVLRHVNLLRLVLSLSILCAPSLSGTAYGQKDCARLLEELKAAQNQWESSESNWRQAADRMATAQRRVADINSQLSKINGDLTRAELDLESTQSDAQDCARALSDPKVVPLIDCSKVPQRLQAAQQKVADLRASYDQLQQELKDLERRVEELEDANAAAHAEERKAAEVLEKARQAYAKCGEFWVGRITRRRFAENSTQKTTTSQNQGKDQTFSESKSSSSEEVIQIDILPDPPLPGITNPDALIVRRYETSDRYKAVSAGSQQCRWPPPTHWESISNETTIEKKEKGSGKARVMVYIPRTGNYLIDIRVPEITYEINKSSVQTNNRCGRKDPDTVTAQKSTGSLAALSVEVKGSINPKTPDVLKGSISDGGDPKRGGETILTWEIRLIKPKGK